MARVESSSESQPQQPFYGSALEFLKSQSTAAQRFWVLVTVVGVLSGVSAALLLKLLRFVQGHVWGAKGDSFLDAVSSVSGIHRLLVPAAAGLLVAIASLLARRPLRGHGTASIIESIWTRSGRLPFPWTAFRGVISIIGVGMGVPLGREGALLSTGAASASALGRRFKLSGDKVRLLVACGASAGIASAYNVPIGGALFGLEVLLGSFALELFGPIVLSCVVATLTSRVLVGNHPTYVIPVYHLHATRELVLALLLGPVMGLVSAVYVKTINAFSIVFERGGDARKTLSPIVAMLCVGTMAVWFPELLGNGYDTVNGALLGQMPVVLLLTLPVLKLAVTAGASGAGVPGGLFTPSLFFGALVGAAFEHLADWLGVGGAPVGAFALLGMAGILAGTTHAAVSGVLIVFEMTGNYDIILPLMLTSAVSAGVSRRLEKTSLYTAVLFRRNVALPEPPHSHWLRSAHAQELVRPAPLVVSPDAPFEEVALKLLEAPEGVDVYVTQPDGTFLGVILMSKVKGQLPDHSLLSSTRATDLMDAHLPRIRSSMSLAEVARLFASTSLEHLPVVDARGKLTGMISKSDLLLHGRF